MTDRFSLGLASFALATSIAACAGEATTEPVAPAPPAVAPVEVTPGDDDDEAADDRADDELATLRARVAELEQELATCRTPPTGTQTAAIPEGADVPPTTPVPAATETATNTRPDAGTRNARRAERERERERGVLGTLLGEDDPPRRRGEQPETIQLPNPARILLGE